MITINLTKRNIILIVLGLLILILGFFGVSYSYLALRPGEDYSETDINVNPNASSDETLIFTAGDPLSIHPGSHNLNSLAGNLVTSTNPVVTLKPLSSNQSTIYKVYYEITDNSYVYTTGDETKPELLLTISNGSEEITSIDGLTRKTINGVTGFDVTTKTGYFFVGEIDITASGDSDEIHNWTFTLTVINLDTNQDLNQGKTFESRVIMNNNNYIKDHILSGHNRSDLIDAKVAPSHTVTATTNEGLFMAMDDYGKSYYYRGAVDNNWVSFGGYYWRIIRINGDGSLRMIYSGETAPTEAQKVVMTGAGTTIGTSAFNSSVSAAEYAGYMYTLGEAHGTTESSVIKQYIDSWFEKNLIKYNSYLSDTLFCGDRGISKTKVNTYFYQNPGIGSNQIHHASSGRIISENSWIPGGSGPLLTCETLGDSYTVNDKVNGNGALLYPISLMTTDEAALAGLAYGVPSTNNYLITSSVYYLLSPAYYWASNDHANFTINTTAFLISSSFYNNSYGVRPVINLKANLTLTGTGTWNDPYKVG